MVLGKLPLYIYLGVWKRLWRLKHLDTGHRALMSYAHVLYRYRSVKYRSVLMSLLSVGLFCAILLHHCLAAFISEAAWANCILTRFLHNFSCHIKRNIALWSRRNQRHFDFSASILENARRFHLMPNWSIKYQIALNTLLRHNTSRPQLYSYFVGIHWVFCQMMVSRRILKTPNIKCVSYYNIIKWAWLCVYNTYILPQANWLSIFFNSTLLDYET